MSHPLITVHDVRILHTSDWHLGRSFHGVQLLDAQVQVLDHIAAVVQSESVDVVVVAGDIYDRAVPSAEAVKALDHALGEIRNAGARIVGISGNHDSAARIGFGERMLTAGGVTLRGDIALAGQPVLIPERSGDECVAFYPIPYLEPESARHVLGEPEARSHERLLRLALDRARADLANRPGTRSVAIVHAFVTGGTSCESELALAVGGSAEVGLGSLRGFDYGALGHLHGRQSLGKGKSRYSGSLMAYSFSEHAHTKGAWLVDLPINGEMSVEGIDYPVQRSLHQLRGNLEQLLHDPSLAKAEAGYVQAVLTDAILPAEPMAQLRRRFPHAVHLVHEPPAQTRATLSYTERVRGKNDLDLTVDFFTEMAHRPPSPEEMGDLADAIEAPVVPGREQAA